MQVPDERGVLLGEVGVRADDLARDDQEVDRRLRGNIVEREAEVVPIRDLRGDFPARIFRKRLFASIAMAKSLRGTGRAPMILVPSGDAANSP